MAQAILKAKATMDGKQFEAEVNKLGNSVQQFGSNQLAGLKSMIAGAFTVGAVASFGRSLLNTADNMKNIAEATNLTMGSLVALKSLGAENNVEFEDLSNALGRLRNAQGEVVNLSKPLIDALSRLKINAREFVDVNPDKALEMIARAYVAAGGSADAYSAVQDILGKNTRGLIEMLKALDKEGLSQIIARTKEAQAGFEALAEAQSMIEWATNKATMAIGSMIGRIKEEIDFLKLMKQVGRDAAYNQLYGPGGKYAPGPTSDGLAWAEKRKREDLAMVTAELGGKGGLAFQKMQSNQAAEQAKLDAKRSEQITENEKRRDELYRQQDDLAMFYTEKQKDILSGKGTPLATAARVDSLQAMGGLVGGAASGPADRAARNQERQIKINEEMKRAQDETNRKLDDLSRKIEELAGVE